MSKCKKVLGIISIVFFTVLTLGLASFDTFAEAKLTGSVTGSGVNMRSGPGKTYNVVAVLQKDNVIKILSVTGEWYKVNTSNNVTGYVSKKYITLKKDVQAPAPQAVASPPSVTGTISVSDLNIRSGPSTSNKVVGKLQKGSSVKVLEKSGDWYKINTSGNVAGWVSSKYVSLAQGDSAKITVSRGGFRTVVSEVSNVIDYAKKYLNVKYVWGGSSPKGFDCSGFVQYVYKQFGISLHRVADGQAAQGTYVKKSDLIPGDLVFFDTNGGHSHINHSGIYIGAGQFIHASSGKGKVTTSDITSGYYAHNYITARRVSK